MYTISGNSDFEIFSDRTLFARNVILSIAVISGGPINITFHEVSGNLQVIRNNVNGFSYQGFLPVRGIYRLVIQNQNVSPCTIRISLTQHGLDVQQIALGVVILVSGFSFFIVIFILGWWKSSEELTKNRKKTSPNTDSYPTEETSHKLVID